MSALPIITSKHATPESLPGCGDTSDDVRMQWRDFQRSLYWQLDRLRSGAGDARNDMIPIVSNMVELAGRSNNLTLAAMVLSLAAFLAKIGPTLTGFQMAELRSILASLREIQRQS